MARWLHGGGKAAVEAASVTRGPARSSSLQRSCSAFVGVGLPPQSDRGKHVATGVCSDWKSSHGEVRGRTRGVGQRTSGRSERAPGAGRGCQGSNEPTARAGEVTRRRGRPPESPRRAQPAGATEDARPVSVDDSDGAPGTGIRSEGRHERKTHAGMSNRGRGAAVSGGTCRARSHGSTGSMNGEPSLSSAEKTKEAPPPHRLCNWRKL